MQEKLKYLTSNVFSFFLDILKVFLFVHLLTIETIEFYTENVNGSYAINFQRLYLKYT